jgi:hypothetical protein
MIIYGSRGKTVAGQLAVKQNNLKEAAYIDQPAINDLYIVNVTEIFDNTDPKYKYGVMRVKHISSSRLELQVSTTAHNKVSGVRKGIRDKKASSDTCCENESMYMDISNRKEVKESGAIYSIKRI